MVNTEHVLKRERPAVLPDLADLGGQWLLHARNLFGWRRHPRFMPTGLGTPPQPLLEGDAERGRAILRGQFTLAGVTAVSAPGHIFRVRSPSAAWHEGLVTLSWIQDLAAARQELARLTARSLMLDWRQQAMPSLTTSQAARALINLSRHAAFLVKAERPDLSSLAAIIALLARRMTSRWPTDAETALLKAVALAHAAVAFRLSPSARETATAGMLASINKVVLPDGGYISRSPSRLVDLALDLIPLRRALQLSHASVPWPLNAAIERLIPMVRLLCHGDGGIAGFQGSTGTRRDAVLAILGSDSSHGRPLSLAPHTGFGRLSYRDGTVIMDTGAGGICHSPLAFEFSDGPQRLIVSCGRPPAASRQWQEALSCSAAHSTWDEGYAAARLAPSIAAESISSPQGGLLRASQEAMPKRAGNRHERTLFLASTGMDLRGEDHVVTGNRQGAECLLRFHLHPAVAVEPSPHPNCVALKLPGNVAWSFSQAGGAIAIEDSVYFDGSSQPQASRQIVVRGIQAGGLDVHWSLRRAPSTGQARTRAPSPG